MRTKPTTSLLAVLLLLLTAGCSHSHQNASKSRQTTRTSQATQVLMLTFASEQAVAGNWTVRPAFAGIDDARYIEVHLDVEGVTHHYTFHQFDTARLVETAPGLGYQIESELGSIALSYPAEETKTGGFEVTPAKGVPQQYERIGGSFSPMLLAELVVSGTDRALLEVLTEDGRSTTWQTAAKFARAGCDAEFIRAMRQARSTPVPPMRPAETQQLESPAPEPSKAPEPFSVDEIVYLKQRGVDTEYVRAMQAAGYRFDAAELYYLKSRGIEADYADVWRQVGYALSASELYYLKSRGLKPDDAKQMTSAGYVPTPKVLYYLKSRGIDGAYVAQWREAGYDLNHHELYYLKSRGVTPDYGRRLRAAGYDLSPEELYYLKSRGIDAAYAEALAHPDLEPLSPAQLYKLKSHGMKPEEVTPLRLPAAP